MADSTTSPVPVHHNDTIETFRKCWIASTDDNNLTLHGFRRFKTTHLLNLRFLEHEISTMDHTIYQAGLSLEVSPSSCDRLGLKHSKRDANTPSINDTITREFVLKLRGLVREYDEALAAFNKIMAMETFSLLDDEKQSSLRDDLTLYEVYKTRLLRVDLGMRSRTDPFQRWLHGHLRKFRYWRLSRESQNEEGLGSSGGRHRRWSYQNTILIADIIGRLTIATLTAIFLIGPLAIFSSSYWSSTNNKLVVVSICIPILSFLASFFLKVSSYEMMAVSAAYAAVLSVFFSNTS